MTATFAITPAGGTALELLDRSVTDTSGIYLDGEGNDNLLPVVAYDEEYVSSSDTEGERRIRSRPSNPQRSGQVLIVADDQTTFAARIATWQQTIEQARRDGGTITFNATGGGSVTCDLETIYISEVPYDGRMFAAHISRWVFNYQCAPYGRLPEVTIVSALRSTLPVISVELPGIPGSVAALGRLTITDLAGIPRDLLEWGLDTSYDPRAPTPVLLTASAGGGLSNSGFAGVSTSITGAYLTTVFRATLLAQPVAICGLGRQVSTGYRRIRSRVFGDAAATGPIWVRLAYWLGETGEGAVSYTPTGWVALPAIGDFYDLDLGLVNVPVGQVWGGQIEAYSGTPGDPLSVNTAEIIPAKLYGKARAPVSAASNTLSAYDTFLQTAGNLAGKAVPSGSTWAKHGASANDLVVDATNHYLTRATGSDTSVTVNGHRLAYAAGGAIEIVSGLSLAGFLGYLDFQVGVLPTVDLAICLIARYIDDRNYLEFRARPGSSLSQFDVMAVVAGTPTFLSGSMPLSVSAGTWYRMTCSADQAGNWTMSIGSTSGAPFATTSASSGILATGGALASGSYGIGDGYLGSTVITRLYDNLTINGTTARHVTNASKATRILSDRVEHEPASGSIWTQPLLPSGSYLKIPPAGAANSTHRLAVKMRQLDEPYRDAGLTDSTQIDVSVTPRVILL